MRALVNAACGVALVVGGLAVLSPSLSAFSSAHHTNITRQVLGGITKTIGGHTLRFSEKAIRQIVTANVNQDDGLFPSCFNVISGTPAPPFADPRNHFDSEQFGVASAAVRDRLNDARAALKANPPNGQQARTRLGEVLHGVQDYYAHSNWVERRGTGPDTRLGTDSFGPVGPTVYTCQAPPNAGTYVPNAGPTSGYWFGCTGNDDALLPAGKCCRGRDDGCPPPPAQIRTCRIAAYGSYRGWVASKRTFG